MSRRPAFPRRAFVPLTVFCLSALAACSKGKESADSTAAKSSSAAAPARLAATPGGTALPGALLKPIGNYTPDEFYTFAHALAFGGGIDKPRTCRKNPDCELAVGKQTMARVDAVDGQDSIRTDALPANGVVVVKARNTGAYEEARYGMRPGTFEYYMVLKPGSGADAVWSLQQLDPTAGARTLTEIATGTLKPCNHPFRKGKYRANFWNCSDAHAANDSIMKMGLMQADGSDPIWVSCSMGCCTFI